MDIATDRHVIGQGDGDEHDAVPGRSDGAVLGERHARSGRWPLYTLPLIGTGDPKRLTDSADGIDADPAWSPDATQIAFRRRVPNGTAEGNSTST